jgi:hypothetical protein
MEGQIFLNEDNENRKTQEKERPKKKKVAYPREKVSQNSAVSQDVDEQSLPSLPQPTPFPFTLSATPETISTIKAKEDKKEG